MHSTMHFHLPAKWIPSVCSTALPGTNCTSTFCDRLLVTLNIIYFPYNLLNNNSGTYYGTLFRIWGSRIILWYFLGKRDCTFKPLTFNGLLLLPSVLFIKLSCSKLRLLLVQIWEQGRPIFCNYLSVDLLNKFRTGNAASASSPIRASKAIRSTRNTKREICCSHFAGSPKIFWVKICYSRKIPKTGRKSTTILTPTSSTESSPSMSARQSALGEEKKKKKRMEEKRPFGIRSRIRCFYSQNI